MNHESFDFFARLIGDAKPRRAVLRVLAGATLGLTARFGLGLAATEAAAAAARKRPKPCRRGKERCDGTCVDTQTDPKHCGRCERRCRAGKRCHAGACVPSCAKVLTAAGCQRGEFNQWLCPGADLSGAILSGCDLSIALLNNADLTGADLTGANLVGAQVAHAQLTDADLTGADLTEAALFASVLVAADLSRAVLTRVHWENTTCPDGTTSDAQNPSTCCGHLNGAVPAAGC